MLYRSLNINVLASDASRLITPGPARILRPTFPSVLTGGAANLVASNQRMREPTLPKTAGVHEHAKFGRLLTSGVFRLELLNVIFRGSPPCAVKMPLACQLLNKNAPTPECTHRSPFPNGSA